jgi:uncharacterized protein YbjT (DUF2867 family)
MVPSLILLTGATGYVGGKLLEALERQGRRVRCLARRPEADRNRAEPDRRPQARKRSLLGRVLLVNFGDQQRTDPERTS